MHVQPERSVNMGVVKQVVQLVNKCVEVRASIPNQIAIIVVLVAENAQIHRLAMHLHVRHVLQVIESATIRVHLSKKTIKTAESVGMYANRTRNVSKVHVRRNALQIATVKHPIKSV